MKKLDIKNKRMPSDLFAINSDDPSGIKAGKNLCGDVFIDSDDPAPVVVERGVSPDQAWAPWQAFIVVVREEVGVFRVVPRARGVGNANGAIPVSLRILDAERFHPASLGNRALRFQFADELFPVHLGVDKLHELELLRAGFTVGIARERELESFADIRDCQYTGNRLIAHLFFLPIFIEQRQFKHILARMSRLKPRKTFKYKEI